MTDELKLYIDELNKQYKTGIAREHSYRPVTCCLYTFKISSIINSI